MTFLITNTISEKLSPNIYKLIELNKLVYNSPGTTIILDFSDARFLNSIFLTGLYTLINYWKLIGRTVEFTGICFDDLKNYFNVVQFPKGYRVCDIDLGLQLLKEYNTKRYTPLIIFPCTGDIRENCLSTVLDIVAYQTQVKGGLRIAIDYMISELTNNIAEHSGATEGAIFVQTYPKRKFIDISIADNGDGIFASYMKTNKFNPETEPEAIEMAMNGCSTKDIPESRGFGISTSRRMIVEGMKGTFFLWSGETMFVDAPTVKDIVKLGHDAIFKGCFVSLRLPMGENDFPFYDYVEG